LYLASVFTQQLEQEGLNVSSVIVFFDREQGGVRRVKELVQKDVHWWVVKFRIFGLCLCGVLEALAKCVYE
jgi:hypothetical protein